MSRSRVFLAVVFVILCSISLSMAQTGAPDWNRRITAVAVTPEPSGQNTFDISVVWEAELIQPANTFVDLSTEIVILVNGVQIDLHTRAVIADPGSGPSPTGQCLDCTGSCQGSCGSGAGTHWSCVRDAYCSGPGGPEDCRCVTTTPPGTLDLPITQAVSLEPGDEIMVLLRPAPGALPEPDSSEDIRIISFTGEPLGWDRRILEVRFVPVKSFFDVWVHYDLLAINQEGQTLAIGTEIEFYVNGVLRASHIGCTDRLTAGNPCDGAVCGGSCGTSTCDGADVPAVCTPTQVDDVPRCACSTGTLTHIFPAEPIDPDDDVVIILKPVPGALPELPGFEEDDMEDCHGLSPEASMEKAGADIDLDWDDTAPTYDVVRGDLGQLRAGAGDFTGATELCESNDLPASLLTTGPDPAPGEGQWFLIRPNPCGRPGSYDTGEASQVGSRDAEIFFSGMDCTP